MEEGGKTGRGWKLSCLEPLQDEVPVGTQVNRFTPQNMTELRQLLEGREGAKPELILKTFHKQKEEQLCGSCWLVLVEVPSLRIKQLEYQ